jgi:osmotically-inducible protein OsmY
MMKSDEDVRRDVVAEFAWDRAIDATAVELTVKGGVVKLSGSVSGLAAKHQIEAAVKRVCGVKAVTMELNVKLSEAIELSDDYLARTARQLLDWTSSLGSDAIHIVVEDGWITLSGKVDWNYQKCAAEDEVRRIRGLKGLVNDIGLSSALSTAAIQANVEAALTRVAQADPAHCSVHVRGNEVTLSGMFESWVQRDSAEQAAWCTPGVRSVINEIRVEAFNPRDISY